MRLGAVLVLAFLLPAYVPGQERKDAGDAAQYKVEFHIQDSADTAAKGVRRYSMLIDANSKGTFRVGNRVPYASGSFLPNQGGPATTQYQYADVGVNIETRLRDAGAGKIGLSGDFELSGIVQKPASPGPGPNPTISSLRITVNTVLLPGKRVLVASVDDPITMRNFNIEATVTKMD